MRSKRVPVFAVVLVTFFSVGVLLAETDFSGEWTVVRSQDNTENPWVGDFVGLPLNAAGLARAESWDASLLSLPEYQCRPHGWAYISRGPTQLRISKDMDPFTRELIAYQPEWHQSTNSPVFVDGRQRPPDEAPHVWGGYSTAAWEGDVLRIETTHLKEDYIRRNGAMMTDEATVTTWWIRRGDYLTWINIVHDPSYLTEPLIRSWIPPDGERSGSFTSLHLGVRGTREGPRPALSAEREPVLERHPGGYGIPPDLPTGGPETMYPEFQQKLKASAWSSGN